MKRAFTLLEVIFVIIIIGIVSAVGSISIHPQVLNNDAKFIELAIENKRREGIAFDHRAFGGGEISDSSEIGCITLTKSGILNSFKGPKNYTIKSSISGSASGKKICFNHLGMPSEGNYTNVISSTLDLNISYNKKSLIIKILPVSGYVIIMH